MLYNLIYLCSQLMRRRFSRRRKGGSLPVRDSGTVLKYNDQLQCSFDLRLFCRNFNQMLNSDVPALILAPMQGVTDAPMRALQGEIGAFTFAVSEFVRVSQEALPRRVFARSVPELETCSLTPTGLPVQVQLLGGDAGRMAQSAFNAWRAGAQAIDINFGCPAPTVNRNDGGATLLKYPKRVREIVRAIRDAVPSDVPVSAKLRLGWDDINDILENADMAAEGGASWITIHGRTRVAGYAPPAYWHPIGQVRERLHIPVVANGDIWTLDDFRRCREETGCRHFMLGRGAMANPLLSKQVARELGLPLTHRQAENIPTRQEPPLDWEPYLRRLIAYMEFYSEKTSDRATLRLKQWLRMASTHDGFDGFEAVKRTQTVEELFAVLATMNEGKALSTSA